jgi:organic radical activating enzyme
MKHREFLLFEWAITDKCDLNCPYCINKGVFSQKPADHIQYTPGYEIDTAKKIIELSSHADNVTVHLTGGEPLLADYFIQVLSTLSQASNISISLITNGKKLYQFAQDIIPYFTILDIKISLHIHHRTTHELHQIIEFINLYKHDIQIHLSQVDHMLTANDRKQLSQITDLTGINVGMQPFVAPYFVEQQQTPQKNTDKKDVINQTSPESNAIIGKRCCLGYSHFMLLPNGKFHYNLWCQPETCKTGYFLDIQQDNFSNYILDHMKKCPMTSCGCNYNMFHYEYYQNACKRLGYADNEIF